MDPDYQCLQHDMLDMSLYRLWNGMLIHATDISSAQLAVLYLHFELNAQQLIWFLRNELELLTVSLIVRVMVNS